MTGTRRVDDAAAGRGLDGNDGLDGLGTLERVPHGRTARRLRWPHLPPALRAEVERRLGSPVVAHESQDSGFTPGFASRLTCADGSRAFVKAASMRAQKPFAAAYATEARTVRLLPATLPMPRLLWEHSDDDWVVLAFACVEGRPPARPWRDPELAACLATLVDVAEQVASPPAGLDLRPMHEDLPALVTGWADVRATRPDHPHLDDAAALAARLPDLPDGGRFVHGDGRDDNFLLGAGSAALLCDWNWPCLAPPWVDVVALLVSAYGDGLDADAWLAENALTAGVSSEDIDVFLAAFAGFMRLTGDRPLAPSSPFLRVHGRWYAAAAWSWLSSRRGWA